MNIRRFEIELLRLLGGGTVPDPSEQISLGSETEIDSARALNAAFLITLAGPGHPLFWEADVLFERIIRTDLGSTLGRYYQRARSLIWRELEALEGELAQVENVLSALVHELLDSDETEPGEIPAGEASPLANVPVTTAYLRRALEAVTMFAEGRDEEAAAKLEQCARDDSAASPTDSP